MSNRVNVDLSMNARGFVDGINQATQAAAAYETDQRKINDSLGNFRKELNSAKKEVFNLASAYSKLSQEEKNSQFGKEMAKRLEDAKERAAELIDMQGDLTQQLRNMASDTGTLDALGQGFNIIAQGASAASGAIALFTGDEEKAKQAVVAFTTVQSAFNTVKAISNALEKQSALMVGIGNVQTLAAAAAARIKAAAEESNAAATAAATAAQAAFNVVAKANPYLLIAGAIALAVGALGLFTLGTEDATDEEQELEKQLEKNRQAIQKQRDTYLGAAQSLYATASRLDSLIISYRHATDELSKTEIVKEAATEFKKLGINVKGVDDAQEILVKNGGKIVELLRIQADAAGIAALRMEAYKKSMQMLMENGYDAKSASILAGANATVRDLDDRLNEINAKAAKLKGELNVKDTIFDTKNGDKGPKYVADSLAALKAEYSKYKQDVENGIILKPRAGFENFVKDFADYEKRIKDKEIEIGIRVKENKDVPFTEDWYKEQIRKLEEQKAALPLTATVDRQSINEEIERLNNEYNTRVKLEAGIDVKGKAQIEKIFSGNGGKTINELSESISILKATLESTDWSSMENGEEIMQSYVDKIHELQGLLAPMKENLAESLKTPIEKANDKLKETQKELEQVCQLTQAAGQMFSSLGEAANDKSLKVTGIIAQAIATIALSYTQAMTSASKNWITWLTFGATGIAQLASLISQIKSLTAGSYSEGGVIGGHSYRGDKLMAYVNSNEVIMNEKQQQRLLDKLENNTVVVGMNKVYVEGRIKGTDIILVQKNMKKSAGLIGMNIQ